MGKLSLQDESRLRRIRDAVFGKQGIGHLSKYVKEHTFLRGKPYSTKGYEFQEAIMDDASYDMVVGKPRQVGMTEMQARLLLAFLATVPDTRAQFIMPHIKRTLHVVKSRYDPIIKQSPDLSSLLVTGNDSASFKQIGSSQLITAGTNSGDIISDPTDLRVSDEYAYFNFTNFISSESAMDNSVFVDPATGIRGIRRDFGTPLRPKQGISARYDRSDKKQRLVLAQCGHWSWPHYKSVVVDGWDRPVIELEPSDIDRLDNRGLLPTARILCPVCHAVIPQERLAPQYREWVKQITNPNVRVSGWWITPFDLPYDPFGRPKRTAEWLIRMRIGAKGNLAKYHNHTLGLDYQDETNSINTTGVTPHHAPVPPYPHAINALEPYLRYGLAIGCDTGKPSYVAVGKPYPDGRMDVLYLATVPVQGPNAEDLADLLKDIFSPYCPLAVVIDGQPYTPSVLSLQSKMPAGTVYACDFRLKDHELHSVKVKVKAPAAPQSTDYQVSTHRTRTLSALASAINRGLWRFPDQPDLLPMVIEHLSNITKTGDAEALAMDTEGGDEDSTREEWVSSGADHFALTFNYLNIAADIIRSQLFTQGFVPLPTPMPCTPGGALVTAQTHNRRLDINRQGTVLVDNLGTEGVAESLFNHFR